MPSILPFFATRMSTAAGDGAIVTTGLVLNLDAANPASYPVKNFVSAKIYSTYNGGLRSSNYTVQYSDDNSTWTTAFSGVATNNTSCGIQQNTGVGSGSYGAHRYWRYVEGSAIASHHPRVSRIILTDINGNDYPFITYTTDNCSDTGTYIVGTVSVDVGGTTWTSLVGGSTATLTNGPTFTSAGLASYITLDGSNDYIALPVIDTNANFSLEFWALQTGIPNGATLFSGSGGAGYLQIRMSEGGMSLVKSYTAELGGFGATSGTTYNTINQLFLTRSGTTYSAYTNGTFRNTLTINQSYTTSGQAIGINTSVSEPFSGRIYVFRYYNTVLSASDITQNYNALRGRYGL